MLAVWWATCMLMTIAIAIYNYMRADIAVIPSKGYIIIIAIIGYITFNLQAWIVDNTFS